jgi:uncharacterized repeat protein (TIGR03803 family)
LLFASENATVRQWLAIRAPGTGALSGTMKTTLWLRIWNPLLALACAGLPAVAHAQRVNVTMIHAFSSLPNDEGANPESSLALGPDGCLYGTTSSGGSNGFGTIFRMTTNGALTLLGTFSDQDNVGRYAGLALGPDGNLYGTTLLGGTNGAGDVFQVATNGGLSTIYSFSAHPEITNTDGAVPVAGLTLGHDRCFYGTTAEGGAYGQGTFFKITTNGILTPLGNFDVEIPSGVPEPSSLTIGLDGNFYGTTTSGGANGEDSGTIFKAATNGVLTTLDSFNPGTNGAGPSSLALGPDGNFYGTTSSGGTHGMGTVFQVTPGGALSTLVNFNSTNGASPSAALALGPDGNFYGTTFYGGTNSYFGGTIFRVTTNSQFTSLYSFAGANNEAFTNACGANPSSTLTLAPDGSFYGTAFQMGPNAKGTIFKLTILPPALTIQSLPGSVVLGWDDPTYGLQTATNIDGAFTNIPFAISPFTNAILSNSQFFRLVGN